MDNYGEIDALIIRNLAEIEQAYKRIRGPIRKRLEDEAGELFRGIAREAGWIVRAQSLEDDFWMAKPAWKIRKSESDEEANFFLFLAIDWDSTQADVSWVGHFIGGQASPLLVTLDTNRMSEKRWKDFLQESAVWPLVQELGKAGLTVDPNNRSEPFAAGVTIDAESLALAFAGDGKFPDVFGPLATVLQAIVAKEEVLDELANMVRRARV